MLFCGSAPFALRTLDGAYFMEALIAMNSNIAPISLGGKAGGRVMTEQVFSKSSSAHDDGTAGTCFIPGVYLGGEWRS